MSALKICPFCSCETSTETVNLENGCLNIECDHCGAMMCGDYDDPVKAWNTRLSPWVDVKERLPELRQVVLAYGNWRGEVSGTDGMELGCGEYRGDGKIEISGDKYQVELVDITHWQPVETPNLKD